MKQQKKELDGIKADLQSIALSDIENKNIKYVQLFGTKGNCEAAFKEKFEVDNFSLMEQVLGELAKDKVTRKEEVKFDVENRFKEALIALVKGNYAKHNIDDILTGMGIEDAKGIKLAKKKLKGDYRKDKALLESLGVRGDMEEELDAIKEAKNMELIERFFDLQTIDIDKLKKSIWLEEILSITINYNSEDGAENAS